MLYGVNEPDSWLWPPDPDELEEFNHWMKNTFDFIPPTRGGEDGFLRINPVSPSIELTYIQVGQLISS